MEGKYFNCATCRYRGIHFPGMGDGEISMQECLGDGERLGARPDHAVWQGRVWRKEQLYSVCGLGTGPGLLGRNCRHTYYPFIPGVSVRNYSDEWLEAKVREEAEKKPFRGKEYNLYEATQKQRQMETAMRAQREKVKLLQEGKADKDDIINAKCKYQVQLDEYAAFSKKFNLPEQRERIYYDLKGRVAPSASTCNKWKAEQAEKAAKRAAAKERKADRAMRERAEKNRREDMDKAVKSGIMNKTVAKEESAMGEAKSLGNINISILEKEFGKIQTSERIGHIKERHQIDYELFERYGAECIQNPDYIIKDNKNVGTVSMVKKLPDTNLNAVSRLALDTDKSGLKNSVMTFYRIRDRNLKKLIKKNVLLYRNE